MSRIYTVSYQGTITNAGGNADWLNFTPADDKPIKLRGLVIGQVSEVGDTAEENLRFSIMRYPATLSAGSGGSAVTPVPVDDLDVAAGFTARANDTTPMSTSGTAATLLEGAWNERNTPYEMWWPDPEFAPKVRQASGLAILMQTTPADDFSITITAYIEEE